MRRDFSKKYHQKEMRFTSPKRRSPVLVIAVAILLGAVGLVGYEYKKHPESFPVASANISRLMGWMMHEKQASVMDEQTKTLAINEEPAQEQVHFEFYTTLPNVKMAATKPAENIPVTKTEKPVAALAESTTVETAKSFIDANELEKDFSEHLADQPYVVQLGVFGNMEAANGYKQGLHRAGFDVDVVKIPMNGKIAYRVQYGPFNSKDQARLVQKQFQKKNVSSLIRKAVALQ